MFNGSHGEYSYMRNLLNKFTEFMEENGYSTQHELSLGKVFTNGLDINTHFHTIEECYAAFKMLVNGFCSLEKKND